MKFVSMAIAFYNQGYFVYIGETQDQLAERQRKHMSDCHVFGEIDKQNIVSIPLTFVVGVELASRYEFNLVLEVSKVVPKPFFRNAKAGGIWSFEEKDRDSIFCIYMMVSKECTAKDIPQQVDFSGKPNFNRQITVGSPNLDFLPKLKYKPGFYEILYLLGYKFDRPVTFCKICGKFVKSASLKTHSSHKPKKLPNQIG